MHLEFEVLTAMTGLQRRVDWYEFTRVSEVCTASIIRAMSKPLDSMAVTSHV
jgi:hypothetical protein